MKLVKFIGFVFWGLVLGTYLAFTDWWDNRGSDTDGEASL